jgi:hypothetical protein
VANLLEIKTAVANYFEKVVADLTVNSQDLFLFAANQVRRQAELTHDFEFQRKLVTISVNGVTGGSLSSAVLYGTNTAADIKSVIDCGLFDTNGNFRPVEWTTVAEGLERQRGDNRTVSPRYPTDDWFVSQPNGVNRFEFTGDTVYRFPKDATNNFTLGMEVYTFWSDWTASDLSAPTTDTWTKYGAQFLQWATIVQINYLFKSFVFRQEGNLNPPDKLADSGLASFIEWDAYRLEENRRHGR